MLLEAYFLLLNLDLYSIHSFMIELKKKCFAEIEIYYLIMDHPPKIHPMNSYTKTIINNQHTVRADKSVKLLLCSRDNYTITLQKRQQKCDNFQSTTIMQ